MSLSLCRQRFSVASEMPKISQARAGVTMRWQAGVAGLGMQFV
tara:strand:+ start:255 stop:383 length:129 start_codon:yes stop_codon:yes gene_type:complete